MTEHQTTKSKDGAPSKVTSKVAATSKTKIAKTESAPITKIRAVKKTVDTKAVTKVDEPKQAKTPSQKKAEPVVIAEKIPQQKKTSSKKSPAQITEPSPSSTIKKKPSPEERYRMVETAAYFIAERSGFSGDSTEHWAAAEREILTKLGQ